VLLLPGIVFLDARVASDQLEFPPRVVYGNAKISQTQLCLAGYDVMAGDTEPAGCQLRRTGITAPRHRRDFTWWLFGFGGPAVSEAPPVVHPPW